MRGWDELGVVDTIYEDEQEEEEDEDESSKSLPLTPSSPISPRSSSSLLSPPPSLYERVVEWTALTGRKTDVVVRLHDRCFNLHKEPLISRSSYLCRRLTESTDITVNPPPGITADVFAEIVIFCYDSFIQLTPANLAAVRISAYWLEIGGDDDGGGNGGLAWQTEIYFRQEVAGDVMKAGHVMSACVRLLPDVTAALLAVRCVDVLAREEGDCEWMEELTALPVEAFRVVAESMGTWFAHDHDLLYRIVDYYLENHRENLAEEEKSRVCYTIECSKLSHDLLLHLVQNPRLPLRFVVQAMLIDQLHTRHAYGHLSSAAAAAAAAMPKQQSSGTSTSLTLGAILQRDAAKRQAAHLRATMEATSFRIESLERDLDGLRRKLRWSEEKRAEMESVRSSSYRVAGWKPSCEGKEEGSTELVAQKSSGKGLGRKLMDGFKSVFKTSPSPKKAGDGGGGSGNGSGSGSGGGGGGGGGGDKRRVHGHRRNLSFA